MKRPTFVIETGMVCGQHLAFCVDKYSREVIHVQVAADAADAVAKVFVEAVAAWGVPEAVVIDNAPPCYPLACLCHRLGIAIEHTAPYRPVAKPVERVHLAELQEVAP